MKHLFTLKSLMLTLVMLCGLNAWGETYSFEITTNDFNSTSYAANNNEKTTTAVCTTDASKKIEVTWYSNQVMLQSRVMQWQKDVGYIYNKTDLGTIISVDITSTSGTFTTYYGTSENPTSGTTVGGGFFNIKVGNATGKTSKIVVTFEVSDAPAASIAIEGEASKTQYEAGETFSTSGLKVIATRTDGTTSDVTGDVAWTFDPETLAVGTTTVKITATYQEKTASKDVNVTVVAEMPTATLDLSTTDQVTEATDDKLIWNVSDIFTVVSEKTGSTKVTNYYPGTPNKSYTHTRFYKNNTLTFTPAANYEIVSITYNGEKDPGYFASSTWTNASATLDGSIVTVKPVDGTKPIAAVIANTTGASSMVIKYVEVIATTVGLKEVLDGNVGGKYQINCALRVNYKDANYAYASTTENNSSKKNTANEGDKGKGWSDKEGEFNQNDWVAIQNSDLEEGAEIATGSVATLVSNGAFPVIEFVSMSKPASETPFEANTFRVANFNIGKDENAVKYVWLVAPQAGEYCHVRGYVAAAEGGKVTLKSAQESSTEIIGGNPITVDPVKMTVNYTGAVTTGNWFSFTGIVVNGKDGLELNAISAEDVSTGVEGVETSSVKVYGAEGVINVESEEVAPIAVYSANGAIVSSVEASSASIAVAPGFYIVKAGNSVSKVTVK